MLIFWNMAGVPLSYCHCTIYLANHDPSMYRWNRAWLGFFFVSYLFAYWIWDTAGSQKSRFKQMQHGGVVHRKAFPQLPWQTLENPRTIKTDAGGELLVDGWCTFYILFFVFVFSPRSSSEYPPSGVYQITPRFVHFISV